MTALSNVKMAVFAPMPSASEITAIAVNPGVRSSERVPRRASFQMLSAADFPARGPHLLLDGVAAANGNTGGAAGLVGSHAELLIVLGGLLFKEI
jgi:hypothetical protein